jgi:hypothetical protein
MLVVDVDLVTQAYIPCCDYPHMDIFDRGVCLLTCRCTTAISLRIGECQRTQPFVKIYE